MALTRRQQKELDKIEDMISDAGWIDDEHIDLPEKILDRYEVLLELDN